MNRFGAIAFATGFLMCCAAQAGEVDMLDCSGLPCVSVQAAGGASLKLLIDTGDATSVLDANKAKAMGLTVEPAKDKSGKPIDGYFVATLKDARLGKDTLGDIKFLVMNLDKDITAGTFPKSDGSIAYTALKNKVLTLD